MSASAAIHLYGVTHVYSGNVTALRKVTLTVQSGTRVAIIGQNGSGKTTLARHLNGLLRPMEGAVAILGRQTAEMSVAQLARQVGYLFQNPDEQLFQHTVAREVAFGPKNLGAPAAQVEAIVAETLAALGLESFAETNPYDLGQAWRKRVALAAVMAMNTPVLVLDEPTTGQDAAGITLLARLLQKWEQERKTILMISHNMEFVARHFPRIIVMGDGRILHDGAAEEVLSKPELLNAARVAPPAITRLAHELGLPRTVWTVPDFLGELQKKRNEQKKDDNGG